MAREQVGPSGSVAGLDGHPGMLATARAQPGADKIEWYESSMESMPLPDASFDVALCQMGLQFVTDKQMAVRQMNRVLTRGGRLLLSVPGPIPQPFSILADVLARRIGEKPAMFAKVVFSLSDEVELRALAEQAGFGTVTVSAETRHLLVPAPADFLRQYIQSTPLAEVINQIDESSVKALVEDVVNQWQPFAEPDGRHMRLEVRMSTVHAENAAAPAE
jgi:SAM-dependent methyltransferase